LWGHEVDAVLEVGQLGDIVPARAFQGAENSKVMFLAVPFPMLRTTIFVVNRPV
jgi:hypothetical protein